MLGLLIIGTPPAGRITFREAAGIPNRCDPAIFRRCPTAAALPTRSVPSPGRSVGADSDDPRHFTAVRGRSNGASGGQKARQLEAEIR